MGYISSIFIPLVVLVVISHGLFKKVEIYSTFLDGVLEGLKMAVKIFPSMFAMIVAVNILLKSNFLFDVASLLSPILSIFNFPAELLPLALLRPVSGSAALAIMDNLLLVHGADSFIGRVASVIQGSTDTTIYIISLYFGSIGIKKIRYSLVVGLLADLACILLALFFTQLLF